MKSRRAVKWVCVCMCACYLLFYCYFIVITATTVIMAECQVCDALTSVKKVNKTDAVTLLSTFGVNVMH